jgi:hypothetical protein
MREKQVDGKSVFFFLRNWTSSIYYYVRLDVRTQWMWSPGHSLKGLVWSDILTNWTLNGIDRTEHITKCTHFVEGSPPHRRSLCIACGFYLREHLEHDDLRGQLVPFRPPVSLLESSVVKCKYIYTDHNHSWISLELPTFVSRRFEDCLYNRIANFQASGEQQVGNLGGVRISMWAINAVDTT